MKYLKIILKSALLQRNEKFYKIAYSTSIDNFSILSNENIEGDLDILPSILKNYLEKSGLKNLCVLIGINEFSFQKMNIPVEVEDDEFWFLENSDKFMPEGRTSDEFLYSYKKIMEDDYSRHYLVVTVRKDFIEKVIKSCNIPGINLLAILPFLTALLTSKINNEANQLLLIFLKNKLQFVRRDFEDYFDVGEIYYNREAADLPEFPGTPGPIIDAVNKMTDLFLRTKQVQSINIILACPQIFNLTLRSYIQDTINIKSSFINNNFNSEYLPSALIVNNFFENIDSLFNLVQEESGNSGRDLLERQSWLNITLLCGAFVLILLLISNFSNSFLKNEQNNRDANISALSLNHRMLKRLKQENAFYKSNLGLLYKLRDKKSLYSSLLLSFNNLTNTGRCLTNVSVKNLNDTLLINITGLAFNQTEVSDLLEKIESSGQFHNVSLIYSSTYKQNSYGESDKAKEDKYISFSIRYEYYGR